MPRPLFDIEQYELRLIKPDVFTKEQSDRLNLVTARVNQQLDWTAQLLGMNGTSYWGLPDIKADGEYTWHGLPETPNEKRQLQATVFGVYAKDRPYEERPAPFNRSEIKASGDQGFEVWENSTSTVLSPLYGSRDATFLAKPFVFAGGSYVFDCEVEFSIPTSDLSKYYSYTFEGVDKTWTRLFVNTPGELIGVRRKGSTADFFWLIPISWEDSSDWKSQKVLNDFIGLWGNKGNNFSVDAVSDAVDLHGFDEVRSLVLKDTTSCFTMDDLLKTVGLRATPWTGYYNTKFGFKVNNSTTVYPLPPQTQDITSPFEYFLYNGCNFDFKFTQEAAIPEAPENVTYNDGHYDKDPASAECLLNNGTFDEFYLTPPVDGVNDGNYDEPIKFGWPCYSFDEFAISKLCFEYIPDPDAPCALLDLPCLEWLFDPTLNNGIYDETITTYLAWADADDGLYDQNPLDDCDYGVSQGAIACADEAFCGFDDGSYDSVYLGGTEYFEPNCEPVPSEPCPIVDGGFLKKDSATPPNYAEVCNCAVECCDIDDGILRLFNGQIVFPPITDGIINGGEYLYFDECTTYDNDQYDRDPLIAACALDDGLFSGISLTTEDSGEYDRTVEICPACDPIDPDPDPVPCPVTPVRVDLKQYSDDFKYKMEPNVANALTPLRVWKNRPLVCTDTVPGDGSERFNYLLADENKGPEPFDSFRYYLRLPLEYVRNGKWWNRAVNVASNQGYFSAPSHLSETQNDPAPQYPRLWDEAYNNYGLNPSTVYYNEPFLVSTIRTDSQGTDAFFEDAAITYEEPVVNPFAPALISDYDPFALRISFTNGDWKGQYYVQGSVTGKPRSGFLNVDVADGLMTPLPEIENPVWDESRLKRPNLEFPDDPDQASLKNYVVSYAYFCADFSASDDPCFDPDNEICWRKTEVACFSAPNEGEPTFVQSTDCVEKPRPINTAYLLHPDGTATTETQTPAAVLAVTSRQTNSSGGYGASSGTYAGSGGGGSGY